MLGTMALGTAYLGQYYRDLGAVVPVIEEGVFEFNVIGGPVFEAHVSGGSVMQAGIDGGPVMSFKVSSGRVN